MVWDMALFDCLGSELQSLQVMDVVRVLLHVVTAFLICSETLFWVSKWMVLSARDMALFDWIRSDELETLHNKYCRKC